MKFIDMLIGVKAHNEKPRKTLAREIWTVIKQSELDNYEKCSAMEWLLELMKEEYSYKTSQDEVIEELCEHKEIKNKALKGCEERIIELTKALNNACDYIHNDGVDGCPYIYDIRTIDMEKQKECDMCVFNFINYYDDETNNCEYQNKSIKCWKEYFMKMVEKND